ncbi:MAG: SCP2 sterol-binding domain-containing protein [Candidatus Baldrarchaeia archaeon]
MVEKKDVEMGLKIVKERFSDPEVVKSLEGFTKTVLFEFNDLSTSYVLRIENGQLKELNEETVENPDVKITMSSETFVNIINKKTNPIKEYTLGKIKTKGSMTDLLKLRKLLF